MKHMVNQRKFSKVKCESWGWNHPKKIQVLCSFSHHHKKEAGEQWLWRNWQHEAMTNLLDPPDDHLPDLSSISFFQSFWD